VSDLRRQRDAALRRAERAERENAAHRAIHGDLDPLYAKAFSLVCDIATNGVHRPLGARVIGGDERIAPPGHHAAAYHLRNEERRDQRRRAAKMLNELEKKIDGPGPVDDPQAWVSA
jgi:hypothetical protein